MPIHTKFQVIMPTCARNAAPILMAPTIEERGIARVLSR